MLKRYPLFYFYVGCVLLKDLVGLGPFVFAPAAYPFVYWPMELATVVASFAVIVEIFRGSVRHNPGIVRFIQNALLMAFGITAFYVCLTFSYGGLTSIFRGIEQLGRDLRFVEGGLVIALLWLLVRYRITLGRNLLGLIVGYSFWIGINLTDFAFLPAPGDETSRFLRAIVPASYAVTLAVWCTTLWSVQPEPAQSASQLEHDYEYFAAKTRDLIARTSDSVTRVMKP
jgi:multisubunit Na+/H+ antiporter MnhE subunit